VLVESEAIAKHSQCQMHAAHGSTYKTKPLPPRCIKSKQAGSRPRSYFRCDLTTSRQIKASMDPILHTNFGVRRSCHNAGNDSRHSLKKYSRVLGPAWPLPAINHFFMAPGSSHP